MIYNREYKINHLYELGNQIMMSFSFFFCRSISGILAGIRYSSGHSGIPVSLCRARAIIIIEKKVDVG